MSAWERLGQYVVARRVQLGYKTRQPFADALGISRRTLGDIETGRRDKYELNTIAALENTLKWATGSIDDILAGGEPTPIPDIPTTNGDNATPVVAERDEALRRVMLAADLTDDQKRLIVKMLIEQKRDAERRHVENAEQMIRLARGEN